MPDPSYLALGEPAAEEGTFRKRGSKVLTFLSWLSVGLGCGLLCGQVLQVRSGPRQHLAVQDPAIDLYSNLKASSRLPLTAGAPPGGLRHMQKASFSSPGGLAREQPGRGTQSSIAVPATRFLHTARADAGNVVDYCVDCGWVYKGRVPFKELDKDFVCPQCQSGLKRFGKKDITTDKVLSGPEGDNGAVVIALAVAGVVLGGLGYVASTIS